MIIFRSRVAGNEPEVQIKAIDIDHLFSSTYMKCRWTYSGKFRLHSDGKSVKIVLTESTSDEGMLIGWILNE